VRARAKLRRGSRPSVAARAEDAAEEGDETDQVGPRCQRRGARVGLLCARRAEAKCGAGSRAGKRFAGLSGKEGGGLELGFGAGASEVRGLGRLGSSWAGRRTGRWVQLGQEKEGRAGVFFLLSFLSISYSYLFLIQTRTTI
jgi:hypothetical protein